MARWIYTNLKSTSKLFFKMKINVVCEYKRSINKIIQQIHCQHRWVSQIFDNKWVELTNSGNNILSRDSTKSKFDRSGFYVFFTQKFLCLTTMTFKLRSVYAMRFYVWLLVLISCRFHGKMEKNVFKIVIDYREHLWKGITNYNPIDDNLQPQTFVLMNKNVFLKTT